MISGKVMALSGFVCTGSGASGNVPPSTGTPVFLEQGAVATPWRVMKFGGTSVAAAEHWSAITEQVRLALAARRRPLVVVSALAGVTDRLLALEQGHLSWNSARDALNHQHMALAEALGLGDRSWLEDGLEHLAKALGGSPGPRRQAALLAVGEDLSSRMGAAWFAQQGLDIPWVDACEALHVVPEPDPSTPRAWLSARCEAFAAPELAEAWASRGDGLIAPGFVARAPDEGIALLGRSGSDTVSYTHLRAHET